MARAASSASRTRTARGTPSGRSAPSRSTSRGGSCATCAARRPGCARRSRTFASRRFRSPDPRRRRTREGGIRPTEGGHADFAPRTADEIGAPPVSCRAIRARRLRARAVGARAVNIHRFTHPDGCAACDAEADPARRPSRISPAALERRCPRLRPRAARSSCRSTAPRRATSRCARWRPPASSSAAASRRRSCPALQDGRFMRRVPREGADGRVRCRSCRSSVILNDRAGLLGAAVHAILSRRCSRCRSRRGRCRLRWTCATGLRYTSRSPPSPSRQRRRAMTDPHSRRARRRATGRS